MNLRKLCIRSLRSFQKTHLAAPFRNGLLRASGLDIDPTAVIRSGVYFQVEELHIGKKAFIGNNCQFYASVRHHSHVTIGSEAKVAPEVMFCCMTHHIGVPSRRAGEVYNGDISVGDGCWIGTRAILLPGVNIGAGSVVAAGAVVTKDVPPNCVGGGIPFRVIRYLDDTSGGMVTEHE
jgi:maltose O-acetyltransferase